MVLALVRAEAPLSGDVTARYHLEQHGGVLAKSTGACVRIGQDERSSGATPAGRRRRVSAARLTPGDLRYYLTFTGEGLQALDAKSPVALVGPDGAAASQRQSAALLPLRLVDLQQQELKEVLCQALTASGQEDLASILRTPITVHPPDHLKWSVQHAVAAGTAVVVTGAVADRATGSLHLVSGDLLSWSLRGGLALHGPEGLSSLQDSESGQGSRTGEVGFTAVLPEASDQVAQLYAIETDASGETTFFGPLPLAVRQDEEEAIALVQRAFGPIQALPVDRVRAIYRPLLALPKAPAQARRFSFGPERDPAAPLCSVIIPLYGDTFLLNCIYHLQRVLGAGFEVIVVVDDPRIWPEVYGRLCARSGAISLPTVLLQCAHNYGYARANNLGFRAARGDVVILMNSDIMVTDPSGLVTAAEAIRSRRHAGDPEAVIGFSLLYEDETLQHIGLEFPRSPLVGHRHIADHPMKGLPFAFYEGEAVRRVAGTTGALMALSSDLYRRLGGLDTLYERGDFEDADLCLRAQQQGAEIWVHVQPGLYHLERQSIRTMGGAALREKVTYLNCVEFNERWGSLLSRIGTGSPPAQERPAPPRRTISVRKRDVPLLEQPRAPTRPS